MHNVGARIELVFVSPIICAISLQQTPGGIIAHDFRAKHTNTHTHTGTHTQHTNMHALTEWRAHQIPQQSCARFRMHYLSSWLCALFSFKYFAPNRTLGPSSAAAAAAVPSQTHTHTHTFTTNSVCGMGTEWGNVRRILMGPNKHTHTDTHIVHHQPTHATRALLHSRGGKATRSYNIYYRNLETRLSGAARCASRTRRWWHNGDDG